MDEEAEERWRALDVEGANQGGTVEASRHLPRGPLMEIRSLDLILFHRAQNYDPTLLWGTRARASARWRRARVAYIRVGLSHLSSLFLLLPPLRVCNGSRHRVPALKIQAVREHLSFSLVLLLHPLATRL